jgi:hypothetical protein
LNYIKKALKKKPKESMRLSILFYSVFLKELEMKVIHEYFLCDACEGKDFKRIYNFSLKFHGVNFSDDLVYDRITDEIYQCANCKKTFTNDQIEEGIQAIKTKNKNGEWE